MVKTNKKWKKHNRKDMKEFKTYVKVNSVDKSLGLVFGWGIICKKDGLPYIDHGDDHIPENEMLEATYDFMKNSQVVDDMHDQEEHGTVVYSMPLTEEIAKAYNIESNIYGWMVGVKPDPDLFEKFVSGEYTGFSIGGVLETFTEVDEIEEFYNNEN